MQDSQDPLIVEITQMQRDRRIIVVAAVIGILAGAALGMAYTLGALGSFAHGAGGARNPAALIFFLGPFALCMLVGQLVYAVVRRLRP